MKKLLLSSMLIGAMTLVSGAFIASPASAACPLKQDKPQCDKPAFKECKKPMTMEEREKFREQKKAEFEERLKLTDKQKKQLEEIKAEERKQLAPYREKIEQEHAKIAELFKEERNIRMESMKKFEALLTPEQLAELTKIKEEMKAEMQRMAPPMGPDGRPLPPRHHHKPMCPPDCGCNCHNPQADAPDQANCKCPCHDKK